MALNYLLLAVPVSLALEYIFHSPPLLVFIAAAVAIVPLAEWIRKATEQMAKLAGPAIGGLMNVTFGNLAELILALFVLTSGSASVVKAQITGSIIGNGLLGLGLAVLVGTFGRGTQTFSRESAGRLSSMLILSVIGLLVPALFDYTERGLFSLPDPGSLDENLSLGVSIVLIAVYILNLVYSLITNRDEFEASEGMGHAQWPLRKSLAILIAGTAVTALEAELIAGSLESAAGQLGLSTFFLGIIALAIIGNAAEYAAAIYFARQDKMNLVMNITVGSTIQMALFIAPLLVILSYFTGNPMNLVFSNPLELIAVVGVAFAVNAIAEDGSTTWFEGVLLVAVYLILALAFLFVTPT